MGEVFSTIKHTFGMNSFKAPNLEEELKRYKELRRDSQKYGLQVDNNFTAFDNQLLRYMYKNCVL